MRSCLASRPAGWHLLVLVGLAAAATGCAHGHGLAAGPHSRSAQRFAAEAAAIRSVAFEEDFLDARLVFQALPLEAPARRELRAKLLDYLLGPIAGLDAAQLRRDPAVLGVSNDDFDRIHESLRDALDLFAPAELWDPRGPRLTAEERRLVGASARAVVDLFSPRGNETAVATGLFVLASLEPQSREWRDRIDQLIDWLDTGKQLGVGAGPLRGNPGGGGGASPSEVLEAVASSWPAPPVVERLTHAAYQEQADLATALRRPLGTGTSRGRAADLLLDSEAMQAMAVNLAARYLRCGEIGRASEAVARLANRPGDDPDLRQLLAAAARPGARPEDFLALARRFLPRIELLGGTSGDRLDPIAAAEVLRLGLARFPGEPNLLVVASRVARHLPAPFLALRYLEEAQAVLERSRAGTDVLAGVAAEHVELSFSRLRVRIDPERIEPAAREAETLRRTFAESRRRFGSDRFRVRDVDIDFELARGFVDAGLIERAEPLLERARGDGDLKVDVALQIANLAQKRGDAARAAQILADALRSAQQKAPAEETIGSVEGQSKLARALGNAYEVTGRAEEARRAWGVALIGWERLRRELLGRRNLQSSAEATFEVGRLTYLLGKRPEGMQKFVEAIDQNEGRDQSYIDALAFLVQQGEVEAALDVYRRAISKPARMVSEYVKVYASLWIVDLTRRSTGTPDASAEAYLRALDARKIHLRPARASGWYMPLVRFSLGRISYEQLLALADTPGKRAELYFYEAMRRLADGRGDDAHALWTKVLETRMFSFFEFEMAARYLRTGAPSRPRPEAVPDAKTI